MKRFVPRIPTGYWLALFPITFLLHFAEEFWCGEGYPAYLFRLRGVDLSTERFLTLQLIGFTLVVAGCFVARWLRWGEFCALIFAAIVFSNGVSHTITAVWDGGYGPGLIVSALIWIPLGVLTFFVMFRRLSRIQFIVATIVGVAINAVVAVLTLRGFSL